MLTLLVGLVILALIVWGARTVIAAIGAPAWMLTIILIIALIVAVIMVANFFGIATPQLTGVPFDPGMPDAINV